MIGEGERICVLDSGFTKTPSFYSQYGVESFLFSSQSSSSNDLLNHGTASISVRQLSFISFIHHIVDLSQSKQRLSGNYSASTCFFSESSG